MIGLVLDIETTGYRRYQPNGFLMDSSEILEFAYLRVDTESAEIYDHGVLYFYKPYFEVESEAQATHGLTREFLEKYEKQFDMNLVKMNSLMQKTCVIGKNSDGFDIPFIWDFIAKHSNNQLNFEWVMNKSTVKSNGVKAYYDPKLYSVDIQSIFAPTWRSIVKSQGRSISSQKKGTLSDYVEALNLYDEVEKLYAPLEKDRVGKQHTALYDVCMTYEVWLECKRRELV